MPALSTTRGLRNPAKSLTRCRNHKKAKTTAGSHGHAPYDFLNQSFAAVSHFDGYKKTKTPTVEKQFFASFNQFSNKYKLNTITASSNTFPYSLLSAFEQAKKELSKSNPQTSLIITQNKGDTMLATVEEIGISYTLYYVSLNALDWLHQRGEKNTFRLMLSISSYLYNVIRMSLPSGNDFLTGCYDAIADWLENSECEYEPQEWKENKALITAMRRKQPILEGTVRDHIHLYAFEQRVKDYQPLDKNEEDFLSIAKLFLSMYTLYPQRNFFDNIYTEHLEEPEDERAYPDQYFSFFWDDNGWLHDCLMEYINSDLQERCVFEQPAVIEYFHSNGSTSNSNLDFEKLLLQSLSDLSTITYKLTT